MVKYLFGDYLLEVDERRLLRDNEEIRLRGKLFDTLRVLVENAGKLVRKDAFMESVWPDSVVEDNNLDYCISQLRKLLHPEKCIETVPRHGYRFVAPVRIVMRSAASQPEAAAGQCIAPLPRQDIRFFRYRGWRAPGLGEHWRRTSIGEGLELAHTFGFRVGKPNLAALVDRTEQTPSSYPLRRAR